MEMVQQDVPQRKENSVFSSLPDKSRREKSICGLGGMRLKKPIIDRLSCRDRQERRTIREFEFRMFFEETGHHFAVFLRFKRAGCIDKDSTREQQRGCRIE